MPHEGGQPVRITRENYRGWPDTYRLSNGRIEARVVTAIGPRIIDLHAAGGPNLFHVRDAEAGGRGEAEWMFRGGWRLWIAPERRETTYALDNAPCQAEVEDGHTLRVTAPAAAGGRHPEGDRDRARRRAAAPAASLAHRATSATTR